ncbi:unnamed protein product [Effrenium voratum]|nr:unnamed protein product [Effrenium voratum]
MKDQFTAGLVSKSLGTLDFSSNNSLALLCSVPKLQELRQMLQHELAFRCLALACVQQNALLLDAQTRWREQNDIGTVGLSRDAISMDGGLGVMRRLRDSLEVSGHDQHHAHARAEEVPSAVTTSEISRASVEDKGQGSAIMDMSRYAQYLQQPARYLEPVLQALGRTSTRVIFKLLRCSALLALRFGCELLLGLQLAQSASSLAGIAMLIPKSLTPFTYGDRLNPLVRDGQVGSVFSLPSTFDALRLALPIFDPSKVEALVERADLDFEVQLLETLDLRSSSGPSGACSFAMSIAVSSMPSAGTRFLTAVSMPSSSAPQDPAVQHEANLKTLLKRIERHPETFKRMVRYRRRCGGNDCDAPESDDEQEGRVEMNLSRKCRLFGDQQILAVRKHVVSI